MASALAGGAGAGAAVGEEEGAGKKASGRAADGDAGAQATPRSLASTVSVASRCALPTDAPSVASSSLARRGIRSTIAGAGAGAEREPAARSRAVRPAPPETLPAAAAHRRRRRRAGRQRRCGAPGRHLRSPLTHLTSGRAGLRCRAGMTPRTDLITASRVDLALILLPAVTWLEASVILAASGIPAGQDRNAGAAAAFGTA